MNFLYFQLLTIFLHRCTIYNSSIQIAIISQPKHNAVQVCLTASIRKKRRETARKRFRYIDHRSLSDGLWQWQDASAALVCCRDGFQRGLVSIQRRRTGIDRIKAVRLAKRDRVKIQRGLAAKIDRAWSLVATRDSPRENTFSIEIYRRVS